MHAMILRLLIAALLSGIAFILWATMSPSAEITPLLESGEQTSQQEMQRYTVTRVLDGDTIVLSDGNKVRYIGIDTPELYGTTEDTECFAQEAKRRNQELILGKTVRLERDVSETDEYGRLLRYVYIDDPLSSIHEETSINEILVHEGYAFARTFPPDVAKQELLQKLEEDARDKQFGLWRVCR